MTHDINAAIRRARAVINVLDEDLAAADRLANLPLPRVALPPDEWARAETARREIEAELRDIERAAEKSARLARDWEAKAALAIGRHDEAMARLAMERAEESADDAEALQVECREIQIFLTEWAIRITHA